MTRTGTRALLALSLLGILVLAGCGTTGGPGDIPVTVRAQVVDEVPYDAEVISIENESIVGSPLESIARTTAAEGNHSESVPPERSDEVADVFDVVPRSEPPDGIGSGGIYVRVGDSVVYLEDAWPG